VLEVRERCRAMVLLTDGWSTSGILLVDGGLAARGITSV
jgi:hypothetical protein